MAREVRFPVRLSLTGKAYDELKYLDETSYVGTPDYLGLGWFWSRAFRQLRDATPRQRQRVHRDFMLAELKLDGTSQRHAAIVDRVLGPSR